MTIVAISAHGATTTTVGTVELPVDAVPPVMMSPPHRPIASTAAQMAAIATLAQRA